MLRKLLLLCFWLPLEIDIDNGREKIVAERGDYIHFREDSPEAVGLSLFDIIVFIIHGISIRYSFYHESKEQ